ncbi:hypothetical protein ACFDR9_005169 [Janthinobacterium sp. CG_23.3]|uniref:hypothetical protein n=1 Tax=Janthinobacterium sp. CG_23.3 TaxID=3349634 RepID=UPI0038D414BD
MNQIITIDAIKAKARDAFKRGQGRDSHAMNWHSAALPTWLEECDRLAALAGEEVVA